LCFSFLFFSVPSPSYYIYSLSLHDALPIYRHLGRCRAVHAPRSLRPGRVGVGSSDGRDGGDQRRGRLGARCRIASTAQAIAASGRPTNTAATSMKFSTPAMSAKANRGEISNAATVGTMIASATQNPSVGVRRRRTYTLVMSMSENSEGEDSPVGD